MEKLPNGDTLKGDIVNEFNEKKEQLNELKEKLPKIQGTEPRLYKVSGRVYNGTTDTPIKGADINIIGGGESIPTKSKEDGSFEVDLTLNYQLDIQAPIGLPVLKVTYPNLAPGLKPLITQEKKIRESLGVIGLIDPEVLARQKVNELKNQANDYINQAINVALSPFDKVKVAQRKLVTKQTSKAQNLLFPLLLEVLGIFGLTQDTPVSEAVCPSPQDLQRAIDKRNQLLSQLNQIFVTLITNAALAYIFQQVSLLFKNVEVSISSIPLPLGAPIGVGIPYAIVSKIQEIEDLINELSDQADQSYKNLLISLIFLLAAVILILLLLEKIDGATQKCIGEDKYSELDLVEVNQQLAEIAEKQTLEGNPTQAFINGFEITIEDTNSGVGDLRRRQAVAKNPQGVVVVKGEPSFSAVDQILIEELKYYIESNDLKAF